MTTAAEKQEFDFDHVVGLLLAAGVVASVSLIAVGTAWRWLATGQTSVDYQLAPKNLFQFWVETIRQIASGAFRPRTLVNLGIAVLLATPYSRVIVSMFHFAFIQRNLKYTLFTMFVLLILTWSLFFNVAL